MLKLHSIYSQDNKKRQLPLKKLCLTMRKQRKKVNTRAEFHLKEKYSDRQHFIRVLRWHLHRIFP